MAILQANLPGFLDKRILEAFYDYLKPHEMEFTQWCEMKPSKYHEERVIMAGELPMPGQVDEYEEFPETTRVEGPTKVYTHVKYGFRLLASEELIEDALWPILDQTASAMGTAMHHRMETQGAYDLNNAFTSATINNNTEYLIQTSHATFSGAGGGTQNNAPSTDVTLGVDSLWAAINNFDALLDREGNPVRKIPQTLVIHGSNERVAIEILESTDVAYKSTNEKNALTKKAIRYVKGHYLSSTTAWYVITDMKPIRFYLRRAPRVKVEDEMKTESRAWQISTRLSHGAWDWMDIYGTDGVA